MQSITGLFNRELLEATKKAASPLVYVTRRCCKYYVRVLLTKIVKYSYLFFLPFINKSIITIERKGVKNFIHLLHGRNRTRCSRLSFKKQGGNP